MGVDFGELVDRLSRQRCKSVRYSHFVFAYDASLVLAQQFVILQQRSRYGVLDGQDGQQ